MSVHAIEARMRTRCDFSFLAETYRLNGAEHGTASTPRVPNQSPAFSRLTC